MIHSAFCAKGMIYIQGLSLLSVQFEPAIFWKQARMCYEWGVQQEG